METEARKHIEENFNKLFARPQWFLIAALIGCFAVYFLAQAWGMSNFHAGILMLVCGITAGVTSGLAVLRMR